MFPVWLQILGILVTFSGPKTGGTTDMFSICMQIIEQGALEGEIEAMARAEKNFNAELGVIDRHFFQCVQQPHVIWAVTKWRSEAAHNAAAAGIMKVRSDDRVASAYFRPGLYFEIFAREIEEASLGRESADEAGLLIVCHGLVADRWTEGWAERLVTRSKHLSEVNGLLRCRTFFNSYAEGEFVAFVEWRSAADYEKYRETHERTLEEHLLVGAKDSELAAYIQFECKALDLKP